METWITASKNRRIFLGYIPGASAQLTEGFSSSSEREIHNKRLDSGVKKVIEDYDDVLKRLGCFEDVKKALDI